MLKLPRFIEAWSFDICIHNIYPSLYFQEGGLKWRLAFLSNEYVKIPEKKSSFLVWFENFEALFPSNLAISQANMLRKPITR